MASNRDDPLSTFMNPSTSSPVTVSDGDSFLLDTPQIGSASGSLQNDGFLTALDAGGGGASSGSDAEFGFTRSEFRQSPLVGSVDYYQRHVFLCYKNPQVWPPRIEAAEFDRLPRLLSAVLVARKSDMKRQTRLTICEGHDGTETSNGDVLIFPDMIRYRRLTHFDVDTFVEEVLVKDGEWLPGSPEPLRGSYIFVCAHGTRDRRCGVCGPAVIARFKDEIESHGLQSKVSVRPCSHIGGHKYAGNVIIFGSSINGKVSGHWYGYVMPDDVITLLKQHIEKGEVVDWLWRGQMGLSEEDQKKSLDLRVQANGGSNMDRSPNESEQTNEITSLACGSHLERTSCCQTNGKSPCCCSPVSPEKPESPDLNRVMFTADKAKGSKKQVSRSSSGKGTSTRKVCTMPTWFESWEREDTYAVLAVISAAVSVVVAYNCYKHLSDGSRAVSSTESFLCSLEDILSRNSTGRGRAWMSEAINKPSQAIENRSTPENDCTNLAGGHSCESNHCQGLDLLRRRRRRR